MDPERFVEISDILAAAVVSVDNLGQEPSMPSRIWHFTSTDGALGIIQNRSLWASLANCSCDSSEVDYGRQLVTDLIGSKSLPGDPPLLERVSRLLTRSTANELALSNTWSTFVVSFCAHENSSGHWLHYGRYGTGVALGLNSQDVQLQPYVVLEPVIYKREVQEDFCKRMFSLFEQQYHDLVASCRPGEEVDIATRTAVYLTIAVLTNLPRLKHSAFESEQEWRLVALNSRKDAVPRYRVDHGRIIPYLNLDYAHLPVEEIVLGASSPLGDDDPGLRFMLNEVYGKEAPAVRRSRIPVRP